MSKFDYSLGAILVLFSMFLFGGVTVHWSVTTLLVLASTIFVLFIVKIGKERCSHCGHYFQLTVAERLTERKKRKKCDECRQDHCSSNPNSHTNAAA